MNGTCAGGTGAYIDEMAALLNVPVSDLDALAGQSTQIYPMASRCGVFGKTDVQNLLSREVPHPDIAASILHAVVLQTLTTLARGIDPEPLILFSGGPLTFIPALRTAFLKVLELRAGRRAGHRRARSCCRRPAPPWRWPTGDDPCRSPRSSRGCMPAATRCRPRRSA